MNENAEPLYPILKDGGWALAESCACFPLLDSAGLGANGGSVPLVAFGYQREGTFSFLSKGDVKGGEMTGIPELLNRTLGNLKERNLEWKVAKFKLGWLSRIEVVFAQGDALAAERILDETFLRRIHEHFRAETVLVGVPRRGLLLATIAHFKDRPLNAFCSLVASEYRRHGQPSISPVPMVVRNCRIIGLVEGLEDAAKRDQDDEEQVASMRINLSSDDADGFLVSYTLVGDSKVAIDKALVRGFTETISEYSGNAAFAGIIFTVSTSDSSQQTELEALCETRQADFERATIDLARHGQVKRKLAVRITHGDR